MVKSIFSNNRGMSSSKMIVIATSVVVLGGGIIWFNNSSISDNTDGGINLESSSSGTFTFSDTEINQLQDIIPGASQELAQSIFKPIDTPVIGDVHDPGITIVGFGAASFTFDSVDIDNFNSNTGVNLREGIHTLLIAKTEGDLMNPEVAPQFGLGFSPATKPVLTGEFDSDEPITRFPHNNSFFKFPIVEVEEGWVASDGFNMPEGWSALGADAAMFGSTTNPFWAAIIPQEFIGTAGQPGVITLQMFGRQTPEGGLPTADDPIGVSGGSFFIKSIPEPFDAEIFTDGFESGDVSAWSTTTPDFDPPKRKNTRSDVPKDLPVITEQELKEAIELYNNDVVFDDNTIGLVSERFGILEPLPPARGTYFFDEFESFR